MSPEDAVRALEAIKPGDPEYAHSEADDILLASAVPKVRQAYDAAIERTGPWWYA